jgi:superfamily II DNA/RNA helicase
MKDDHFENFDDMNLKEELLRGIYAYGFEKPSDIQKKTIIPLSKGENLRIISQSGTGKTATLIIGALQSKIRINLQINQIWISFQGINTRINKNQLIIITPSIELAIGTSNLMNGLGNYLEGLNVIYCVSRNDKTTTLESIKKGKGLVKKSNFPLQILKIFIIHEIY